MLGHFVSRPVGGYAHRLGIVAHGKFDNAAVGFLAEEDADRGGFVGLAHVLVKRGEVEIQLPQVGGLELAALEFDGDQAAQLAVEEKEVE